MQSAAAKTVKPNTSKTNFRDKRCLLPSLLVDLLTGVCETRLWSAGQRILRDVSEDLRLEKFEDLPPHTFASLETAIQKSNAN